MNKCLALKNIPMEYYQIKISLLVFFSSIVFMLAKQEGQQISNILKHNLDSEI